MKKFDPEVFLPKIDKIRFFSEEKIFQKIKYMEKKMGIALTFNIIR